MRWRTALNMLTQGVTTEIFNADGGGAVDLAAQLTRVSAPGLAVNLGGYIGFNVIWQTVVGNVDRRPTPEEIERMRSMITAGLDQGAWGVSAGLDYKPGYFARTEEVIRIVDVAKSSRTNFTNHDRITPESNFSSKVGIAETVAIGEKSGLVPVVTHMKAQGREQGTAAQLLESMAQATKRGHYTAADAYPYLAGQSGLGSLIIPGWAQEGGRPEMLKRFADPDARARIVKEAEEAMAARFGGPQGVYLPRTQQELSAVMKEMNAGGGETIVRILEQGGDPGAILRFGAEDDLIRILQHPSTSMACDCGASTETRVHPRFYGSFPRLLGRYVREQKIMSWEQAIRKSSWLPASTIGMSDRGPDRARHGRRHRRVRSEHDHRSRDLRESRAAVRGREARVRQRPARVERRRADRREERARVAADAATCRAARPTSTCDRCRSRRRARVTPSRSISRKARASAKRKAS